MIKIKFLPARPADKKFGIISFHYREDSFVSVPQSSRKEISVGLGKKESFNRRKFISGLRKAVCLGKKNKIKFLALSVKDLKNYGVFLSETEMGRLAGENFEMANFEFVKYRTPPKDGWDFIEEIVFFGEAGEELKKGLKQGQLIGNEVNACRSLVNVPGGEMTPWGLAKAAKNATERLNLKVKVLETADLRRLKMGGILGVAKGSIEKPKFIIMDYFGLGESKGEKSKPIVLIGKAVTFDTGGLNLKPSEALNEMHMDMSGGAAVIAVLTLAAKLGLKKNVVGLIPAVENMPSGASYRPGDILESMSGKTIEVLNTDAEGRIILADAITYAKRYGPELVVDIATLTGAAIVALGERASAIFSSSEKLLPLISALGETSGDYVWPLPLWEEYEADIKGTFGDIANVSKSRYGGAINGAVFLHQFAKELSCPWLHIDIAPRMVSVEGDHLAKGAAGEPVRLLIRLLEQENLSY